MWRRSESSAERWDAVIAIGSPAAFHAPCSAAMARMRRGTGDASSTSRWPAHGLVASANKSAYVAAKHGLVGWTKVIALETAKTGITCNAICPGWVLTPLVQQQIDNWAARDNLPVEKAKELLLGEKQPSGEFVTPERIEHAGHVAVHGAGGANPGRFALHRWRLDRAIVGEVALAPSDRVQLQPPLETVASHVSGLRSSGGTVAPRSPRSPQSPARSPPWRRPAPPLLSRFQPRFRETRGLAQESRLASRGSRITL